MGKKKTFALRAPCQPFMFNSPRQQWLKASCSLFIAPHLVIRLYYEMRGYFVIYILSLSPSFSPPPFLPSCPSHFLSVCIPVCIENESFRRGKASLCIAPSLLCLLFTFRRWRMNAEVSLSLSLSCVWIIALLPLSVCVTA